jgi:subtilisin family serine protease
MQRRGRRLVVALVLAAAGLIGVNNPVAAAVCPLESTGRTMVRFGPGVDAVGRLQAAGASDIEAVAPGIAVGALRPGRALAGVLSATPERIRHFFSSTNDEFAPVSWALDVMHADAAAAKSTGAGIRVGVLDSGVDGTHPDLAGRVLGGADATVSPTSAIPQGANSDPVGHGTAVAGVIASLRNNNIGVAGLASDAQIVPVRVGGGAGVSTSAFVRGMQFAINAGVRVINLSFGGCGSDPSEQTAVQQAVDAGIVVVASAGNYAPGAEHVATTVFPAAYPGVLAVGATTHGEGRADYSVTGPWVDVSAPGGSGGGNEQEDLIAPVPAAPGCEAPCMALVAGTSFASPFVAAAAALVRAANPGLTPTQVGDVLMATSIDLGPPGTDQEFGAGRLDADGALALATGTRAITRIAGADRYATAAALSARAFATGAGVAYVARGDTFSPDALAAGPAAVTAGGPVLLAESCALPQATRNELVRLTAGTIVVLGGPGAVCEAVLDQLRAMPTAPQVRRVAGADRFATAAALAADTFSGGAQTAYVARGDTFSPDALVGGAAAGRASAPILLVNQCGVPDATAQALDALGVRNVVVLGGSGAVCDTAVNQLSAGGRATTRIAGADRYATAVAVAKAAFPGISSTILVARGDTFSPDALTAAPYAAARNTPLVLTAQCSAPPPPAIFVNDNGATAVEVAGGSAAVCDAVTFRFL